MKYFLASDVLYERAQGQINTELDDQGIDETGSREHLPWRPALARSAGGLIGPGAGVGRQAGDERHPRPGALSNHRPAGRREPGSEQPGDDQRQRSPRARRPGAEPGRSEETDVVVSFELTGGAQTISGNGEHPADRRRRDPDRIDPDRAGAPDPGQQLTLEVTVQPVPGEQIVEQQPLDLPGHLRLAGRPAARLHTLGSAWRCASHSWARPGPSPRTPCAPPSARARSSRDPRPSVYEAIRAVPKARRSGRWSRSRTRSRGRSARPSTRSPSRPPR